MKQSTAVKVLASGANVFLTGAPGAGKTHLLNRFIQYLRKRDVAHAITAPTGIAATHIGGMTLHSWSGLGIREAVDQKTLEQLLGKSYLRKRFETTQVLIIDEVSMLTPGLFEAVNTILQNVHFSPEPFGGIQVVLTGDFFQLPPVMREGEGPRFIWQTELWKQMDLAVCYLSERHRHGDKGFIQLLDEMRVAAVSEPSQELLQSCLGRQLPAEMPHTRLYTHNRDVDRINALELKKLSTPSKRFVAKKEGHPRLRERILESSILMEELELKRGAAVMCIKNLPEKGLVNGSLGTVAKFDEETGYPIFQKSNREEVTMYPEEWSMTDEMGKTLAKVTQIPLRLAWAITVHKSQGMTLDAAEVDLSKAFEPGQGYVAISRVRDLTGLRLLGLNDVALQVDAGVLREDKQMQRASQNIVEEFSQKPLEEKYPPLTEQQEEKRKERFAPKVPTIEKTRRLLEEGLSLPDIADKRRLTVQTIIKHLAELRELGVLKRSFDHLLPNNAQEIWALETAIRQRGNSEEFTEKGQVRLSTIFREGNEQYSYDDIRLALIFKP